jgi:hypothetical protein
MFGQIHEIGLTLFSIASALSLLFVVAKPLGKEFEKGVLVWIRAFKRIKAEWKAPLTIEPTPQPPQLVDRTYPSSRRK